MSPVVVDLLYQAHDKAVKGLLGNDFYPRLKAALHKVISEETKHTKLVKINKRLQEMVLAVTMKFVVAEFCCKIPDQARLAMIVSTVVFFFEGYSPCNLVSQSEQ